MTLRQTEDFQLALRAAQMQLPDPREHGHHLKFEGGDLAGDRAYARAHGRSVASSARAQVAEIRTILTAAGEYEAAAAAHLAAEALTAVIATTFDAKNEVFARLQRAGDQAGTKQMPHPAATEGNDGGIETA